VKRETRPPLPAVDVKVECGKDRRGQGVGPDNAGHPHFPVHQEKEIKGDADDAVGGGKPYEKAGLLVDPQQGHGHGGRNKKKIAQEKYAQ